MVMVRKLRVHVQAVVERLRSAVVQPGTEVTRWQKALRFGYDLGRFGAKQLREDRAAQMAAALSFRTLFGLVPVLVVATVLFKATQGVDGVQRFVRDLAESLDLQLIQMTGPGETSETLADFLVAQAGKALDLNFAAIGLVGLAVVIYSAISLMVTIEKSFNVICRAPEGRPWMHRLLVYWAVLTLGPAAVGISFWVDNRFDAIIQDTVSWSWALSALTLIWGFAATWMVLFGGYKLIPNAPVSVRSAAVGAVAAAILLEVGKHLLASYFQNALSVRQLYGSLGLIPVFMLWVYIMWLVVMFGLEVASTLESLHGRRIDELQKRGAAGGMVDPARVVMLMESVAHAFSSGRTAAPSDLARELLMPEATVERIVDRLHRAGLLHRVDRDGGLTLARPPEAISADELLLIGFELVDGGGAPPAEGVISRLREAQRHAVSGVTLERAAAAAAK